MNGSQLTIEWQSNANGQFNLVGLSRLMCDSGTKTERVSLNDTLPSQTITMEVEGQEAKIKPDHNDTHYWVDIDLRQE